ncbi:hypothetical protein QTN25_009389 [Entamoeba marina]
MNNDGLVFLLPSDPLPLGKFDRQSSFHPQYRDTASLMSITPFGNSRTVPSLSIAPGLSLIPNITQSEYNRTQSQLHYDINNLGRSRDNSTESPNNDNCSIEMSSESINKTLEPNPAEYIAYNKNRCCILL